MYQYRSLTKDDLSARKLILSLMSATSVRTQSIAEMIRSGELFGIEPRAIRVAVNRLQKQGLLMSEERGIYGPGPEAIRLIERLKSWQSVLDRKTDWDGGWLLALTHHLGRTNRKQLRTRTRALQLNGYRETEFGFWVRPSNLKLELNAHRTEMIAIGVDEAVALVSTAELAFPAAPSWTTLWSSAALNSSYRQAIAAMDDSLETMGQKTRSEVAVEAVLVGQAVIQLINFDPLLPPEFCDTALFEQMVTKMIAYNATGAAAWQDLLSEV